MGKVDLLTGVLSKTGDVIEGVGAEQLTLPTPCEDYDVETLINHLVGWLQVFEAGCHNRSYEGDVADYRCGAEPAQEFRRAAAGLVAGWEQYGFDREVSITGSKAPAEQVFSMTVMEYLTHGWDLATATGQPIPFTEQEAAETLARAEVTLPPQYRGKDMPFGPIVPVTPGASAIDRMVAFMGREPKQA
ncbi:TIGR03086 family metal-binding protein [Streptomyces sp. RKAG290]|uniref:TIGR03086 family metal-binding protein n=1 Tax=Streptomyces sp. RKAG290 TaxID=2888348 RepID=UPI0020349DEE|nr:TIGR03086 family metal-binding protein [Streptomyces sp. RKAG290]MCM2415928.1 TIGR03086 family metal-binding protein [Streptomyces sp. RKAG290]